MPGSNPEAGARKGSKATLNAKSGKSRPPVTKSGSSQSAEQQPQRRRHHANTRENNKEVKPDTPGDTPLTYLSAASGQRHCHASGIV